MFQQKRRSPFPLSSQCPMLHAPCPIPDKIVILIYEEKEWGNMTSQTANILVNKLQKLPPEQQQQVADFIEFLEQKYIQHQSNQEQPAQQRVLGLNQGEIWMSEDFNEPLPDEFWMGEE
ncbi:MAG: DUF2281 domain-containing protein [Cyanobacteria bacterium J06633_8]